MIGLEYCSMQPHFSCVTSQITKSRVESTPMNKPLLIASAVFLNANMAAAEIRFSVPADVNTATFSCSNQTTLPVQFVETGVNSMAVLPVEGEERIFVNVVSGSGARYVSGKFELWLKGDAASLRDLTEDTTIAECVSMP